MMNNKAGTPENGENWQKFLAGIERHWVWSAIYIFAIIVFAVNLNSTTHGQSAAGNVENLIITWSFVFISLIFIQIFTTPIPLPSSDQKEAIEKKKSEQRRRWMIFSYGFMLVSLLGVVYIFSMGWNKTAQWHLRAPDAPLSVIVACSLDNTASEIQCTKPKSEQDNGNATDTIKNKNANSDANNQPPVKGTWVLNIGGFVTNVGGTESQQNSGTFLKCTANVCKVSGGILVPLYVILLALMGGSVSLTRRLPEYQAQANVEYIPTEGHPKLSQHQFREYLIFQIVQFVSAPLLAVLAYYLVEPNNITQTVVLSFIAGFASETILIMIRGVADKIRPTTASTVTKGGSITGTVTQNSKPVDKAEVSVAGMPGLKTNTDAFGHYVLGNVPLGDHAIEFVVPTTDPSKPLKKSESVNLKSANSLVTMNEGF